MSKNNIIPDKWEEVGSLKSAVIYPLKSGQRMELLKAECTEFGLKQTEECQKGFQLRDRFLIIYKEDDNVYRSARNHPKMLLIVVTVHDGAHLSLNAPTTKSLLVKIPNNIETKQSIIKFYKGEEIKTLDGGDEAAAWLSQYLLGTDSGLRLGYHDASHLRNITVANKELVDYYENLTNESSGLYSFLTSVLLVNQVSVDDLIKRMGQSTVTVNNFRANLIVDAHKVAPYSEDQWEWIKIGDVVLRNVKECTRCILTTIDPISASRNTDREPLKTLAKYRVSDGPEKLPVMGIHLEVRKTGFLNVGDTVFITRLAKI